METNTTFTRFPSGPSAASHLVMSARVVGQTSGQKVKPKKIAASAKTSRATTT